MARQTRQPTHRSSVVRRLAPRPASVAPARSVRRSNGDPGTPAPSAAVVLDASASALSGSILDRHPVSGPTSISHERVIDGDPADRLWQAYLANVDPLAEVAILRHVDGRDEFLTQLANPRIVKIVGWQEGVPVGLAMVTNSLEDVAEISPRFLRAKYPHHAERDAIYVGMLVMVSQPMRGRTLFSRLYTELWQIPALVGGILIFDVCDFNRTMFDTDALTQRIADSFPRSSVSVVDRQTWYAAELPEPIVDRRSN